MATWSEAGWGLATADEPPRPGTTMEDLAQLVDDRVTLINTMSGERLDPKIGRARADVPFTPTRLCAQEITRWRRARVIPT